MLRAIIFDFNGILVDDEPLHLEMLQKVLQEEGIALGEKDYYARYLGKDDRGCFKTAFCERGKEIDDATLNGLIERKGAYYGQAIRTRLKLFPGVKTLVPLLAARFPLAIASGALRSEIESILAAIGLSEYFKVVVSAEDVNEGKPDPGIFLVALDRLNSGVAQNPPIQAGECLVIEDSKEGILGSRRAGMRCLAVANSHPVEELTEADEVVDSLDQVGVPLLESLFA